MIEIDVRAEKGKNLNHNLIAMITSVKKASGNVSLFLQGVINKALDVALETAKYNVSGGIIGGKPRLDGHEGRLADSLKKEVIVSGTNTYGAVFIPEGIKENYIGWRQEVGFPGLVAPTGERPMRFLWNNEMVNTWATGGYPASQWLTRSYYESRSEMESVVQQEWKNPQVPEWILGAKPGESSMVAFMRGRYGK